VHKDGSRKQLKGVLFKLGIRVRFSIGFLCFNRAQDYTRARGFRIDERDSILCFGHALTRFIRT
jgi:hypothetical protein